MSEPGGPTFGQAAYAGGSGGTITRTDQVNLTGNSSGYQHAMAAAQAATQETLNVVVELYTHVDQLLKLGGRTLKIMAAGDVAMLGHAASNAAQLQSQMSTLNATASINRTSFGAYGKSVDNAFAQFPQHRGDIVALVTEITNLGVKQKDIGNVATAMEKLGAASGENIPTLTNDLVLLNRQMGGTGATNIGGYANAVLTLSKHAGTSVNSITSFSQAIAPIGRMAKFTEGQILGVSTAFAKSGADGYYAANTFNSILNDITVATKTGSPDLAKYATFVGTTVDHFRRMPGKQQITEVFDAIAKGGPRALNFVNELGLGTRGLSSVQAVAQQGGLGRFISEGERESHNTRNLDRGSHAALSGLDAAGQSLRNQFTRFEDMLGAPLLGPLTAFTHGLASGVGVINAVVSHLGPLPAILAAVAAPLAAIAGIGLSHAALIGGVAMARTMVGTGLGQSFRQGRSYQGLIRGGMTAEEAAAQQAAMGMGVAGAVRGSGRNLWRTRLAFGAGRGRGMFGAVPGEESAAAGGRRVFVAGSNGVVSEEAGRAPSAAAGARRVFAAGSDGVIAEEAAMAGAAATGGGPGSVNRAAGWGVRRVMRFPAWMMGQQANQLRDARASSGLGRSAYEGTAEAEGKAAAATRRVASAEEQHAGVIGSLIRGTMGLVRAFADLAVETGKYSVVLARQGVSAAAGAGGRAVMNRAAAGEAAALGRLREAEASRAAAAAAASRTVAASHEMEAAVVTRTAETETVALTRLQAIRARAFGMVPTGALGRGFGMMLGGQLIGSMIDDGHKGSGRNTLGTMAADAGMGAMIGNFVPGIGPILGGLLGAGVGFTSSRSAPPAPRTPPPRIVYSQAVARTGSTTQARDHLAAYLRRTLPSKLIDERKPGGRDFNQIVDDLLRSNPHEREKIYENLAEHHLLGQRNSGLDLTNAAGAVTKAINNYQAGTATGRNQFNQNQAQIAAASPISRAVMGSPLFHSVAYGDQASNLGAQNRATEEAANTALKMTGSLSAATEQLQKLADAAGGTAGQLLDNAAAYARMLQGFKLPYESQNQRLGTLTGNAVRSRAVAQANPANDYDQKQAQGDQQALAQEQQSYTQYMNSIYTAVREFHVGQVRAQEDYNTSRYRSERNFEIQMTQSEQDYLRSRGRNLQDFNISMARQAQQAAENIYDPFRTVQVQQVVNGGMLVSNLRDENERIERQRQQLAQLRRAGLSQNAIDTLRLSDPNNAQQTNSIAQSVVNDPRTIAQINQQVAIRGRATRGLVQSEFNEDFRNTMSDFRKGLNRAAQDYNTARDRAKQAQATTLDDMAFDFNRMVTRSGQDLTRQMTELYGNFAQTYTRTVGEITKDIGKEVPQLADKLIKEITSAEGRITDAAAGGVGTGATGAGGPGPSGSPTNPITRAGVLGVNSAGRIGEYTSSGRFVPENMTLFRQLSSAQQSAIRSRSIAPPGSANANNPAGAQSYAQSLLHAYGWSAGQMAPLISLWNQESGWRYNARNPSSGAYGIPQSLPADKMASAGADWLNNGATQIRWGLSYIKGRYGSPSGAWAHERAHNWYHSGGLFTGKSVIGVGDVPQGEQVLPLDGRGTNFMVSFYDRVTTALAQRLQSASGQPGVSGTGTTMIHEDHRTYYTGDLKVGANDPLEMERKLDARQRLKRLAQPARARG